jgi:hypothetical protein
MRLQCRRKAHAATVWDVDALHFIDPKGAHRPLWKKELLAWRLALLSATLPGLKAWTVATRGQVPPELLLRAVQALVFAGATGSRLQVRAEGSGRRRGGKSAGGSADVGVDGGVEVEVHGGDGAEESHRRPKRTRVDEGRRAQSASVVLSKGASRVVIGFLVGGSVVEWRGAVASTPPNEWIWSL